MAVITTAATGCALMRAGMRRRDAAGPGCHRGLPALVILWQAPAAPIAAAATLCGEAAP